MITAAQIGRISGLAIIAGVGAALSAGAAAAESTEVNPAPAHSRPSARTVTPHRPHPPSARSRAAHPTAKAGIDPVTGLFGGLITTFFNQSPGIRPGTATQQGNGVVTGQLDAFDTDGILLNLTVTGKPVHGTVTVANDGSYTYTADTSVAVTGTSDSFRITATDAGAGLHIHGLGGLINALSFGLIGDPGHTATTTVSLTVAPFGTAPEGLSTFCGCTLMPADTVFHADVSGLPVLAKSQTWTTLLGGSLRAAWGGEPWMNTTAGMPVNTIAASQPAETVIFNRGLVTSGPTIDDRPYAIPDRPLVEGMPDVPAWDRHLLVFQEGTCVSQELYNVANGVELPASSIADAAANAIYALQYGSTWLAEAGVRYDMKSALYPVTGEANASQLPFLPLILRPDDLARGSIDHMLGIVIAKDRGTGYTWPARSGDGTGSNPDGVPMGTVFRLRADFDLSGYDVSTQVVLRALQEHGAVVYDSWNPGQNGAGLLAMSNGWTGTAYLTTQRELSTVPMSAFEAVDVLGLALDPDTGWMIRP